MKKQQGFTLIELVVVIVILGVLAVTAAPKFINLQADAHTATLNAVKASMQSAATIVHSKALIKGNEKLSASVNNFVTINGVNTEIAFGYPIAKYSTNAVPAGTWASLINVAPDFLTKEHTTGEFSVYPKDATIPSSKTSPCQVVYTQAANANTKPIYQTIPCV